MHYENMLGAVPLVLKKLDFFVVCISRNPVKWYNFLEKQLKTKALFMTLWCRHQFTMHYICASNISVSSFDKNVLRHNLMWFIVLVELCIQLQQVCAIYLLNILQSLTHLILPWLPSWTLFCGLVGQGFPSWLLLTDIWNARGLGGESIWGQPLLC